MSNLRVPPDEDHSRYQRRIAELSSNLNQKDPIMLAENSAANYQITGQNTGELRLTYWDKSVSVSFPGIRAYYTETGNVLPEIGLLLLLYYFNFADGTPETGEWISFSALPDATFYNQAFQGYTGKILENAFQNKTKVFKKAAESLGGERYTHGDISYRFQVLPRVAVLVVFWQGDEDFGSSFQILFDKCAKHYLPTDGYAIIGSMLTRRLVSAVE